jgi:hypothetical protein
MLYGDTYKLWDSAQQFICHYDLLSQITRLKKTMSKPEFFFSVQQRALYMKAYVCFIVADDINFP